MTDWAAQLEDLKKRQAEQAKAREELRLLQRREKTAERNRRWRERNRQGKQAGAVPEGKRPRTDTEAGRLPKHLRPKAKPRPPKVHAATGPGNVDVKDVIVHFLPGLGGPSQGLPPILAEVAGFPEAWAGWMAALATTRALPEQRKRDLLSILAEQPGRALEAVQVATRKRWRSMDWTWLDAPTGPTLPAPPPLPPGEQARREREGWF